MTFHVHFVQNCDISVPPRHSVRSTGWPLVKVKTPHIPNSWNIISIKILNVKLSAINLRTGNMHVLYLNALGKETNETGFGQFVLERTTDW